ncbi:MAG TPA: GGDEF domain-containing protein [Acidimicrobiales bacterium]|nr:GGDEF domain-containing protein [Acidimicrobiales bacterium]
MSAPSRGAKDDLERLAARAEVAKSAEERQACLEEIQVALAEGSEPSTRAALLMCRARVRSNQWRSKQVMADALAAMSLFEEAEEHDRALEAASLAAAHASRRGELSLAAELATKCIVALPGLDDRLLGDVANRLGIFCYSFLDYDRALEQMTISLHALERCGDWRKVFRQLHNVADAALLAIRHDQALGLSGRYDRLGMDRLAVAADAMRRLEEECPEDIMRQLGVQHLQATLLFERGCPAEALELLEGALSESGAIVWAAGQSAVALVEARCLRALARPADAVVAAARAKELAVQSDDHLETMLILDELVAAELEAGRFEEAARDAVELKKYMWLIHSRQTAQLVEQVWARAALEQERKALEAQRAAAMRSAEEDALTRIGNRRLIERVLAELASTGAHLALLMADIDHFKVINDTFGHEVGDHVLRALGNLFAGDARPGQVVVRYGGEEFVFALPSVELDAAADFAERMRVKVSSYPWEDLEGRLSVTISIGAACGPAESWPSVLASADRALYLAKQHGRNRVEIADLGAVKSA